MKKPNRSPESIARRKEAQARYKEANRDKIREAGRAYYARNRDRIREENRQERDPKKIRAWRLKAKYGITYEEYQELAQQQGEVCAICKQKTKTDLHVDHCHVTGAVRGLLCGKCNPALGLFLDRPEILRAAALYLEHNVTS